MKKIVIILAAMTAVLSSCSKNGLEPVSVNGGKDIVLNISVSNPGADDTKALIKSAWTSNDEISIWYDGNTDATPDLVITYNGEKWIQKTGATVSGKNPSTGDGKYAKALYNGTVKVASKDDYTFADNTLTFKIEHWVFLTEVQVVIKGLTSDKAGKYTLACDKFTPLASTGNGYTVGQNDFTASTGSKGTAVTGISNTDGVAFVFATADYSASSTDKKDFAFALKDETSGSEVTTFYKANVAIAAKEGKSSIKALTITSTKFAAPAAPDGFVDLGVVVNSKPLYWAEKNLDATNPWNYGKYFSWGDVTGQTSSNLTFDPGFSWSNAPFNGGQTSYSVTEFNKVKDTACPSGVLASIYDAAYQTNNAWRMPTTEDFVELFKQCYAEWGTYNYYDGLFVYKAKDGDAGYAYFGNTMNKYSGSGYTWNTTSKQKPSYSTASDTFVFFPAAGCGSTTSLSNALSIGYYWSSSLNTDSTQNAYLLYITSSQVYPQYCNFNRFYGYSVRPVSD